MRYCVGLLAALPLLAQETILLRPSEKSDPSAPKEQVQDRGKDGVVDRSITHVSEPSVTVYLPTSRVTGTGIVICPGGSYEHLTIDKGGHDIARWLSTLGIAGIVLKYRLPDKVSRDFGADIHQVAKEIRVALEDAESAVRLVRANAGKWHLKPDAVGMMGFSSGGHLAAMAGMLAPPDARPNFLALVYPGFPATLQVSAATPRTFLVAADDDPLLNPAENAGRFFAALHAAKVPAELHIYSSGGHGFGILKTNKTSAAWPEALVAWLKEAGLD